MDKLSLAIALAALILVASPGAAAEKRLDRRAADGGTGRADGGTGRTDGGARDPDADLIEHLDELENLELLENLDVFDDEANGNRK